MAKGRDRPKKEPKRKAKEKAPKLPPMASTYEPPASVEVIKPRRKERTPSDDEGTSAAGTQHNDAGAERQMDAPVAIAQVPVEKNGERGRAVDAAILQIEKQFGRGSIMRLGDRAAQNVEAIPTGSVALDLALGVGGVPRGRITEIYGPESSGKTTLCYHVAGNAQRMGGIVAFIDAEHALDPGYARNVGVDVDELLVSQPDTGEQALEIAETLIRSNGVDVVIVDSVAALVPRAEIEGDMGDSHMGLQARLMSQALRKLTGAINRSNTALVFTNQLREKIGVMFGNPETTPGGRALKFYASVRMDIRRIETLKSGTDAVGSRTRVKVGKNKVASPFRVAEFDIMYNEGISVEGGLLDVGIAAGVLSKTGAWFNYGDVRLGQGRENSREFLKTNPEIAKRIDDEIRGRVASIEVGVDGISEAE
ncbi:recombinase RecA [soil metagenome]